MSVFRLSILICTLPERAQFLRQLRAVLDPQMKGQPVELLMDERLRPVSTGTKRNALLDRARGDYVAAIDDDDLVSDHYVHDVLSSLKDGPDCAELRGIITTDGGNPKPFIHTIHCKTWHEKDGTYWRYPNHLSSIRRELALQARFPEKNFGEDKEFSDRVKPLLKTMGACPRVIYLYHSRTKKPELH
jgi:hypothetical protein